MNETPANSATSDAESTSTLGALLYADPSKTRPAESDWVSLVRAIAGGDEIALHALYDRSHRAVFTLIFRITKDRQTAEELTLDVFHDIWRRSAEYDPESGTVLGWIMNQARSRAIDRLRFDSRAKRIQPAGPDASAGTTELEPANAEAAVELVERARRLQIALDVLTADERQAIETAYFAELSYAEVAARLNQPVGTVKTRIRSGLEKLRNALQAQGGAS